MGATRHSAGARSRGTTAPAGLRGAEAGVHVRQPRYPVGQQSGAGRPVFSSEVVRARSAGRRYLRARGSPSHPPLPPTSLRRDTARAMSQENVEVVRAVFEAWNAGDMDAIRDACDPEIIMRG